MLALIDTEELQDSEKEKLRDIYETGGTGRNQILLMPKCDPGFPLLQGICLGCEYLPQLVAGTSHCGCASYQGAKLFFVDCKDVWGQLLKKQGENQAGRRPKEGYLKPTLCSPSCFIFSLVLLASMTDC